MKNNVEIVDITRNFMYNKYCQEILIDNSWQVKWQEKLVRERRKHGSYDRFTVYHDSGNGGYDSWRLRKYWRSKEKSWKTDWAAQGQKRKKWIN